MFKLTEKIAVVTGASSGIGAAIATTFAQAGATVYVADRDVDAGRVQVELIRRSGGCAEFVELDVTDPEQSRQLAQRIVEERGQVDVLVNNAGVGCVGTLLETAEADFDRMMAVNVRGVFNVSKAFLPAMIARKSGNIIHLASIGGVIGIRDRLAYCASKFAVVGMTKAMALDHARQGIRVNCLCPGRVMTPFVEARLREYADPEAALVEMSSSQALGRMALPDEIAAAALYLASAESAFMTGTAFVIDGGWSAGK